MVEALAAETSVKSEEGREEAGVDCEDVAKDAMTATDG